MRCLALAIFALLITGCESSRIPQAQYQRFVLVPDPSQIRKDIPAGALALDTKTGLLCYTTGGEFTEGFPRLDMCVVYYENRSDLKEVN